MVEVIKIEDAPVIPREIGSMKPLIDEKIGASKLGIIFREIPARTPTLRMHYHVARESVYIGVEGKAKATVDGKEIIIEPNTIVLILPGEKHKVKNIGDISFKMIEVYSPIEPDRIDV